MLSPFTSLFQFLFSWYLVLELPPQYLPPDLQSSIADLRATYFNEILAFLAAASTVVIAVILIRSWIRSV